jgi:hypothetical protein
MVKKKENSKIEKTKDFLEIFIRPDGCLLLNNISKSTFSVLKEVSKGVDKKDIYCG